MFRDVNGRLNQFSLPRVIGTYRAPLVDGGREGVERPRSGRAAGRNAELAVDVLEVLLYGPD